MFFVHRSRVEGSLSNYVSISMMHILSNFHDVEKINIEKISSSFISEISGPLEIRANKNFFTSGDNLEILCSLPGLGASSTSKGSSFTWKKMNGDLPENCQVNGAKLSIFNLQNDNGGVYRCQLTTPFDTIFADYVIVLEGL